MSFEELVKDGLIGEIKPVNYLFDRDIRVFQQILCLQDHKGVNPLRSRPSAYALDDFGEILWRQAQLFSIESDIPLGIVILRDKAEELIQHHLVSGGRRRSALLCNRDGLSPDGSKEIEHRREK